MVDWNAFDARQREIAEQQQTVFDMRKSLFDFPAGDTTELLQKPMNPIESFDGIITRDDTTGNIPTSREARDIEVLLTSAVALNEARKLFLDLNKTMEDVEKMKAAFEAARDKDKPTPAELRAIHEWKEWLDTVAADKWLSATVQLVKASSKAKSAVSKSHKGWLGELFITLKRKGEISAEFLKPGKSSTLR